MENKKNNHFLLRIVGIWGVGTVFVAFTWLFILQQIQHHQNTLVEVFANNQYIEIANLSEQIEDKKQDLSAVKNNGMDSPNQSTFLYSKEEMFSELEEWKYKGGQNIDEINKLMREGISGSRKVTRSSEKGEEILAWSFFTVDDKEYIVGASTLVAYILTITGTLEHFTRLYMLAALFTVGLMCLCMIFSLYISRTTKRISGFQKEMNYKNRQIEGFQTQLEAMKEIAKKANIADLTTGVYNRDFYNELIQTLGIEDFLPATIININLSMLDNPDENMVDKDILREVAQFFAKTIKASGIIAYLGKNAFGMVLFETTDYAKELICQMKDEIRLNICEDINVNFYIEKQHKDFSYSIA